MVFFHERGLSASPSSLLLLPFAGLASAALSNSGSASTGRYWDCCKPSCAWTGKADFSRPVLSCDARNNPLADANSGTGCNGGDGFACSNQVPWAVNDTFSYGFTGAFLMGGQEADWCCSCFELKFVSAPLAQKTMIIQVSNTDYDSVDENMFTFAIPGGNNSEGSGCGIQYGVNGDVFGPMNQGITALSGCDGLPEPQRAGCKWRFEWLLNQSMPNVTYKRTTCPKELTDITGCVRNDDATFMRSSSGSDRSSRPIPLSTAMAVLAFTSTVLYAMV